MYKILLPLFLTTLLSAEIYNGVAIVVEDRAITLLDIKKAMQETKLDEKQVSDMLIRKELEASEIKKRNISVSSDEVYADIKQVAGRNKMTISQFYDAVREANGLSSSELKEKIKEKLLSQKLYQTIAMSSLSEPSDSEIEEYYKFHKDELSHPSTFDVTIYSAKDKNELQTKINNPMFYSPTITTNQQTLEYSKISPELASLLSKTEPNHFTIVVPTGQGGFMSFYLNEMTMAKDDTLESARAQIANTIMAKKREEVLSDYFARLRDNADINIIRTPKE